MLTTAWLSALLLLCPAPHRAGETRAGGLLGLGLLDGLLGGNSITSTAAPSTTTASLAVVVSDAAAGDSIGPLQALLDLLTGVTAVLPISDLASLLGLNTSPIPSPLADPLGF